MLLFDWSRISRSVGLFSSTFKCIVLCGVGIFRGNARAGAIRRHHRLGTLTSESMVPCGSGRPYFGTIVLSSDPVAAIQGYVSAVSAYGYELLLSMQV